MKKKKLIKDNFKLLVMALSHFMNDVHGSFLPTFVPLIVENLGITYTQAGLLKSLSGAIHMIIQPLSGYLSDLFSRPYALIAGPFMTALGASLLPFSPSYGLAVLFVGLNSLGSAVYHPLGHGGVGHIVPPGKLASSLAIFAVGGILGSTVSSLYAISLYELFDATILMPLAAIVPVGIVAFLTWKAIPILGNNNSQNKPSSRDFIRTLGKILKQIYPIYGVSLSRDTTIQGIRFFLPLFIAAKGGSLVDIGTILFIINIIGTLSPMLGGRLADEFGEKKVITAGMILAPLFLLPAVLAQGLLSVSLYMVGVALLQALLPVTGAAAQKKAPESRSVVASLVTGVAFGLGGVLVAPLGVMADSLGLEATLLFVAIFPWIPMPLFFLHWKNM